MILWRRTSAIRTHWSDRLESIGGRQISQKESTPYWIFWKNRKRQHQLSMKRIITYIEKCCSVTRKESEILLGMGQTACVRVLKIMVDHNRWFKWVSERDSISTAKIWLPQLLKSEKHWMMQRSKTALIRCIMYAMLTQSSSVLVCSDQSYTGTVYYGCAFLCCWNQKES